MLKPSDVLVYPNIFLFGSDTQEFSAGYLSLLTISKVVSKGPGALILSEDFILLSLKLEKL